MAKVKFAQIQPLEAVLSEWWQVKGLPVAFQRQVLAVIRELSVQRIQFDELRKKFVDEFAKKGEDGQPETNGEIYVFENPPAANAHWAELIITEFDCPTLAESAIEENAEKLGLTIERLAVIEAIIAE